MGNCFGGPENSVNPVITGSRGPGRSTIFTGTKTGTVERSLDGSSGTEEAFPNLRIFAFNELKSATRSFQAANMIGEGGFGVVYKAWVDKKTLTPANNGVGMAVAVKKWRPESFQGFSEWQVLYVSPVLDLEKEVDILGKISHPNLINLLGYCCEDDELLLVYEFMEKGSLGNHLFPQGAAMQPLSWEQRLKIAVGAARGLAFLHAPENRIIHRNFTSSHVLLDSNLNPKLTGLGIAREGPTDAESHVSTRVMGTYGYAAPEYIATGHLTAKNDVYGMGVVLLEILSGLRALDASRTGKQRLVEYAKPYVSDHRKLARLMDPRLEGQYPVKAANCAARLAKSCVADDPQARPSMDEVVETLQQIEAMN
ncbi:STYKc [Musa troglodytarum]|uniref:STYKc n=1 Tax=Musa troglodytarum TaxID=320322 RepID=A0A9E7F377_9LILI|nr:STYKc [Musa troglodytarum]